MTSTLSLTITPLLAKCFIFRAFSTNKCRWYKDKAGQLHDKHPVFDYYTGAMFMDKGGYAQLKASAKERPPTADEVRHGSKPRLTER